MIQLCQWYIAAPGPEQNWGFPRFRCGKHVKKAGQVPAYSFIHEQMIGVAASMEGRPPATIEGFASTGKRLKYYRVRYICVLAGAGVIEIVIWSEGFLAEPHGCKEEYAGCESTIKTDDAKVKKMVSKKGAILTIIDPAESNDLVIARAKQLAREVGAPIEFFSCTYNPYFSGERLYESPSSRKAKAHHVVEEKRRLETLAKAHREDNLEIVTDVYWDVPEYEAVVRKVLRSKPLMVLRHSEYHTAVDRALMSNDDWNLIRNCPAPVLMVRSVNNRRRSGVIWAAVDPMHDHDKPAALDNRIIRQAQKFAEALGSEVHLVHAFDSAAAVAAVAAGAMAAEMIPSREIGEQVRETHMKRLQELATKHGISHDRVHNLPGPPRVILPAVANEKHPDIVVMGAVARGFFKRLLIGSTAERILDKMSGDLCVVKPADFKTRISADSKHEFHYQEALAEEKGAA